MQLSHTCFTDAARFLRQEVGHCEWLDVLRKSSLAQDPLYSHFLMRDGEHEKNKTVGQPCSSRGESGRSFISQRLVLHCLAIASRAKKSAQLVPYSVYTTYCFFFFFFKIRSTKGEMVVQCVGAQKFLWMWWKPRYESILSCSVSLWEQVGYHVFQPQITAWSNDDLRFKWGSERYWQGNAYVGYLLIYSFPMWAITVNH